MLRQVFAIGVVFLSLPHFGWSKQLHDPINIGTLTRDNVGAGCYVYLNSDTSFSNPVFMSGEDGTFININGKELELKEVAKPGDDNFEKQEYKAGDVRVTIRYEKPTDNEAGAFYDKVTLKIFTPGQKKIVKAKGSCGC